MKERQTILVVVRWLKIREKNGSQEMEMRWTQATEILDFEGKISRHELMWTLVIYNVER